VKNPLLKHFTQTALQGLFGLLPIVIVAVVILWLYGKIDKLVNWALNLVGFTPQNHAYLWFVLVLAVFFLILYLIGQVADDVITEVLKGKVHDSRYRLIAIDAAPGQQSTPEHSGSFNLFLQLQDSINEGFGGGRTSGNVNIDRHDSVTTAHD